MPAARAAASLDGVQQLLSSGNVAKAAQTIKDLPAPAAPEEEKKFLTTRGETLWLSSLSTMAAAKKPTRDDLLAMEDVKKAKEDLEKANTPEAVFWLGQIAEWTEGEAAAKAIYEAALTNHPEKKRMFEAALHSLERPRPGKKGGVEGDKPLDGTDIRRPFDPLKALMIGLQAAGQPPVDQPMPGQEQPMPMPGAGDMDEEAGAEFWRAVKLAQSHDYGQALQALDKARDLHDRLRFTKLRKSQNPISDPTENIFLTACDELRTYWELRDKLVKGQHLDKAAKNDGAKVLQALESSLGGGKAVQAVIEKLKAENYNGADLAASVDLLLKDKAAAATAKEKAEKTLTDAGAALKAAGVPDADVIKGVADLDAAKKAGEKKVADTLAALKAAGVNEAADPAKGVAALDAAKKAEEKKIADTLAVFKAAGVDAADPVKGAEQTVATFTKALDDILMKLVARKYLPAGATRTDVPAGFAKALTDLDQPAVVALAESKREVERLSGDLRDRWTPAQMLDVWVPLLQEGASKELAERALKDAARAGKDKPSAEAVYVKALAERSQGQFDEARATLTGLLQNAAALPEGTRKQAKEDLKALTEPNAFFMPRVLAAQAEHRPAEAVALIDNALVIFPADKFPKEHAALRAVKSVMQLDMAAGQPAEKRTPMLEQSEKDASAAATAGQKVEGVYALGRVAEAKGNLTGAEKLYRDALTTLEEGLKSGDGAGAVLQENPASDATGNRYRWALGQVILKQQRKPGEEPIPAPVPAPMVPPVQTKPEAVKPPDMPMSWHMWLASQVVAAPPPLCLPPDAPPLPDLPPVTVDPRVKELMQKADQMLATKDYRGYLLKGQAMAMMGQYTEGLSRLRPRPGDAAEGQGVCGGIEVPDGDAPAVEAGRPRHAAGPGHVG